MNLKTLSAAMAGASLSMFALSARASTQTNYMTICDTEQTGEDADCDVCNDPGPNVPPQICCTYKPVYGQVCRQVSYTINIPMTPAVPSGVNRFVNPSTGVHYYTNAWSAPDGYRFEEHAFTLATDNSYGAVPFSLSSGGGYIFPNQSAVPGLYPLYVYYDPRKNDVFYTINANDVNQFGCSPAFCDTINQQTHSCDHVTLPDCYYSYGIVGYVGQ